MKKFSLISAAAGVLLAGSTVAAFAAHGAYHNMSAMALANGKEVMTDCAISTTIGSEMLCFSNEKEMKHFMRDPKTYMAKANANFAKMSKSHM